MKEQGRYPRRSWHRSPSLQGDKRDESCSCLRADAHFCTRLTVQMSFELVRLGLQSSLPTHSGEKSHRYWRKYI
ncbi:hypothetical protein M404DRAFT_315975 [Pisolithus tinctorius Marx 270]|uniref:Uncharacterized protein n=1 Tax=Pisolithus tinctorius Marx 270 TaxID=870435 RepID=A0A0C3N321_PISTI|nr:hypothetical protein M404DRAFT_315975 [Pisolithus tinctorius Marx 270]